MKKIILYACVGLLSSFLFSSCNENSGDNWTLAQTISLGDVSLMVPETYAYDTRISTKVELSNEFAGSSVAIYKEALAGRTQTEVFNYKTERYQQDYTNLTASDTSLLAHPTRRLDIQIPIAYEVYHSLETFIFIDGDYVYTVEFGWSAEYADQSLALMYEMLESMQIK